MRSIGSFLCAAALVSGALGCQSQHLYFATYTKVGISADAVGNTPTHIQMGYDRFEGAAIPLIVGDGEQRYVFKEVPSTYACMTVDNSWFGGLQLAQVFGTGDAAKKAANKTGADCTHRAAADNASRTMRLEDTPAIAGVNP